MAVFLAAPGGRDRGELEQTTLNAGAALASGLIAGAVTLLLLLGLLTAQPRRFPLNPLYLTGSLFTIETTQSYAAGLVATLAVSSGYGVVIAAVFVGFGADGLLPLWGALAGSVLSLVTGSSLAYMRTVSPVVRRGLIGDPGPFLLRYGRWSATELLASHALFGLVAGAVYSVLS